MNRLRRVQNLLVFNVLISAVFQWIVYPDQGHMLLSYLARIVGTAFISYLFLWLADTYEVRRRQ